MAFSVVSHPRGAFSASRCTRDLPSGAIAPLRIHRSRVDAWHLLPVLAGGTSFAALVKDIAFVKSMLITAWPYLTLGRASQRGGLRSVANKTARVRSQSITSRRRPLSP